MFLSIIYSHTLFRGMFILSCAGMVTSQSKGVTKPLFLLALTGLARSGKDTAAKYISRKYGFYWLDMSRDVLKAELAERKIEPTKENLSLVGDSLRKVYGNDIVAQKIIGIIREKGLEKAIVSGVRSPEEAKYLEKSAGTFYLFSITANTERRIERGGNTAISRDERDISNKGLSKVLEMADATIENNGTLDDFYRKIDKEMELL